MLLPIQNRDPRYQEGQLSQGFGERKKLKRTTFIVGRFGTPKPRPCLHPTALILTPLSDVWLDSQICNPLFSLDKHKLGFWGEFGRQIIA